MKNSHQLVISNLFFKLKKNHSIHNWKICKCDLCNLLKRYVHLKIQVHKLKRVCAWYGLEEDDYKFLDALEYSSLYEDINIHYAHRAYPVALQRVHNLNALICQERDKMKEVI